MSQQFVIDRIEESLLILVSSSDPHISFELPQSLFPTAQEGDVIRLSIDTAATDTARTEAEARLDRLKTASPQPKKGDIIDL